MDRNQGGTQPQIRGKSPLAGSSIRANNFEPLSAIPLRAAKIITRQRHATAVKPAVKPVTGHLEQYAQLRSQNIRLHKENEELRKSMQRFHSKIMRQEGANEALVKVVQDLRISTGLGESSSSTDQTSNQSEIDRRKKSGETQERKSTISFLAEAMGRLYYTLFAPRTAKRQRQRHRAGAPNYIGQRRSRTHRS